MAQQPYPGLRPFEPDETDIFFGRETHVDAMVDRLAQHHLLAVTGTSGSGKSSLVKAGLIEAVEIGLLAEAGPVWRIAQMRPRDHSMAELALALTTALGGDRYESDVALRRAALERGPLALVEEVSEQPLADNGNLLIVADQFEELFRYRGLAGREEAEAFVALLLASANQRSVPIYVVLTIRSDYIGECAQFSGLAEAISDAQYLCPRLTREQIAAAIEGPAAVFGGKVEPLLISRIVNDMGTDPDQLPLMQHALMRLWDQAKAHDPATPVLRLADYLAVDGIKGSLSHHADEILAEITRSRPERAETARRLFGLVTEGNVRRLARVKEVMAVSDTSLAEVSLVADTFRAAGRSFLMPPPDRPLDPETVLDLSHESLIRQWDTLKGWVQAESASAEQYRDAERRARRWEAGTAELWGGVDLDVALAWREHERPNSEWATRYGGGFALAMRFLDESKARRDAAREARRSAAAAARRRQRRILGATAAACVMVSILAAAAGWQWQVAERAKQAALDAQRTADQQKTIADGQRARAEQALALATKTANGLIFGLAADFNNLSGVPTSTIKDILAQALNLQNQLLRSGETSPDLRLSEALALDAMADTLATLGDKKGAIEAATRAREIMLALVASDPDNAKYARNLSYTEEQLGGVLKAQGDLDQARAAYDSALTIIKRVAQKDPGSTLWQGDLWQGQYGIGTVLEAQNLLDEALANYRDALATAKARVQNDPENTDLQNALSVSEARIGDVLKAQNHLDEALDLYRESLAVLKALVQKQPENTLWLHNVSFRNWEIGQVLEAQGHLDDALASYREGLAIISKLARKDRGNALWQTNLWESEEAIAGALFAQGHLDEALAAYRDSCTTAMGHVQENAENTEWGNHLAGCEAGIGDVLKAQGHLDEALAAYRESLAIHRRLVQENPGNTFRQADLAASLFKVANAGGEPGANFAEALGILKRLDTAGTLPVDKKGLIGDVEAALAQISSH